MSDFLQITAIRQNSLKSYWIG